MPGRGYRILLAQWSLWPLLKAAGLFSADLRAVLSMRYLWDKQHKIDSRSFYQKLPDFSLISPEEGIGMALSRLG